MYDIGRHPPRGPPRVGLPKKIASRSFQELTAPLARRVPVTVRQRNVHLLMNGSKVLSWKASDALQQVADNLQKTAVASNESAALGPAPTASNGDAVSSTSPCTAWVPRSVLQSLTAIHCASSGSGDHLWMPCMQAEVYGDVLLPCAALRLSTRGVADAPPAFRALLSRMQALGSAPSVDENAAMGLCLCADAGIALSASGRPYGSAAIADALRQRMAFSGRPTTSPDTNTPRLFRMPYWLTEDEAALFGTRVRANETPTVVPIPASSPRRGRGRGPSEATRGNGEQRIVSLFNAEQTVDPTRFNTRSCNTTLYPFVLPGSIMHWGAYRPPVSGGAALAMSWAYQRDSEACSANVWVERRYLDLLGLTDNGKFVDDALGTDLIHTKRLQFLNACQIREQDKVAFYLRYVPCVLGDHGRLFGMNAVLCAKAAFRVRSPSPYWVHWSQLAALQRMRSDDVREIATAFLRDDNGAQVKERFVNVAFSSLDDEGSNGLGSGGAAGLC